MIKLIAITLITTLGVCGCQKGNSYTQEQMVGEYKSWPHENGYRYILKNNGDIAIINKTGKLQSIGAWRLITANSKRKGRMIKYEPVKCSNNGCVDMSDLRTNVLYLYKKHGKIFIEMGIGSSGWNEQYGIIKL